MHASIPTSLAVALLLGSAPALADTGAQLVVSDFLFKLVDLNPQDGIAPSITWDASSATEVRTFGFQSEPAAEQHGSAFSTEPVGPVLAPSIAFQNAGATSGLHGDVFGTGGSISLSSYANFQPGASSRSSGRIDFGGPSGEHFTLAPFTGLEITGRVVASAWSTFADPIDSSYFDGQVSLQSDDHHLGGGFGFIGGAETGRYKVMVMDDLLDMSLYNNTAGAMGGALSGYIYTDSQTAVVPEPAPAALMLLGLGVAAASARRRRA
jgi:hypothetical protein